MWRAQVVVALPTCAVINFLAGIVATAQIFRARRNLVFIPIVIMSVGALYECLMCCVFGTSLGGLLCVMPCRCAWRFRTSIFPVPWLSR